MVHQQCHLSLLHLHSTVNLPTFPFQQSQTCLSSFYGCSFASLHPDLLQLCRGRTQKVRVLCTGALTNVALLVSLYPEVIPRVEIVLMGGAMGLGNTGPVMEFNIQVRQALLQYKRPAKQPALCHKPLASCIEALYPTLMLKQASIACCKD